LKCGFDEVGKFFKKNQTNRVVLLTDGYDSTPVDTLLNFVKAQKNKGIECSVVGVGSDYNVSLLQQIGDLGGGMISMVNDGSGINDAFVKELSSILMPVAKNIKVEVEYNKKIVYSQLYGPSLESKTESKLSMNFKQMYVGLNDFAMIRFNLGEVDQSIENSQVIVRMKYYDLQKAQQIVIEKKVYLEWSDYTGELELQKEKYQKKLYTIALMNQALKVMSDASVVKDYPLAMKTIHETILNVDKTFPKAQDYDVDMLREELQTYYEILSRIKLEK
jgi:von Willebrand factor type A domain